MEKRSRTSTGRSNSNTLAASLSIFAVLCGLLIFLGAGWRPYEKSGEQIGPCSQIQHSNRIAKQYIERALNALNRNDFGEAQTQLRRADDILAPPMRPMGGRFAEQQPQGR